MANEGLEPLRFVKNWNKDTNTREQNWDEIANKVTAFSTRTINCLKQIGLDIDSSNYSFNGIGRSTQTTSIVSRLTTLEAQSGIIASRNIGLDLSTQSKIVLRGADGNNFSSSNKGLISFNSTATSGTIVTYEITANIEVTLTGAHFGHDTYGDLTDYILWLLLIDNGTEPILGVAAQGGRQFIASSATSTSPGSITAIDDVLVSSTVSSDYNCTYFGFVKADFDDTGNAGGENFWTVNNGVGDINICTVPTYYEGTIVW